MDLARWDDWAVFPDTVNRRWRKVSGRVPRGRDSVRQAPIERPAPDREPALRQFYFVRHTPGTLDDVSGSRRLPIPIPGARVPSAGILIAAALPGALEACRSPEYLA